MPELPDVTIYLEALTKRILGQRLEAIQISSPFLLRTAIPPVSSLEAKEVVALRRLGKRICVGLEEDLWIVIHLMIAGRLHWKDGSLQIKPSSGKGRFASPRSKNQLAVFQFNNGILSLTEAGTQRRASFHILKGEENLSMLNAGGLELFANNQTVRSKTSLEKNGGLGEFLDLQSFIRVLQSENHTLKRALTDQHLFSGIGNAYSDEILWQARLSPVTLTQRLSAEEQRRLHAATRETLVYWVQRLRSEAADQFPEKVTAFREGMAVHGRYKEPCPRCGARIQRIRYATNETNYCPACQTGRKLLADRALSRLLREDWPKTVEELS